MPKSKFKDLKLQSSMLYRNHSILLIPSQFYSNLKKLLAVYISMFEYTAKHVRPQKFNQVLYITTIQLITL